MKLSGVLTFLPVLAGLSRAVPNSGTSNLTVQADYDVIIVGGGPAGLSAASGLARVRRNVLLVDSGEYRNAQTRHLHDVIGFDGESVYLAHKIYNFILYKMCISCVTAS